MFWNKYPYTDFHELNLDWLLKVVKDLAAEYDSMAEKLSHLDEIEAYVKSYLEGLDWSGMASDAIQELYDSGDLADLIAQYIAASVTPSIDQLSDELSDLEEFVSGLQNAAGAYKRDSSTTEAHDLDFYYISRAYTGDDSDGSKEKPYKSIDEAIENTFLKGIFAPNMRFLAGGQYTCSYSVFNAVTWHLNAYTAPQRPSIVFTGLNNITFYNSHINWAGIDVITPPGYYFRAENSEIHLGEDFSIDGRIQLASCGAHLNAIRGESISLSNSKLDMEGACTLSPEVLNAFVISYNSEVVIEDLLTIEDSGYSGSTRGFYVFDNSRVFFKTAPAISAGHAYDMTLRDSEYRSTAEIYAAFTRKSLSGTYVIRTASEVIE